MNFLIYAIGFGLTCFAMWEVETWKYLIGLGGVMLVWFAGNLEGSR